MKRSLTFRTKYLLGMSLLIFCAAFLVSLIVFSLRNKWDYGVKEAETVIDGISYAIEGNLQNYKEISRLIMLNMPVRKFLRAPEVDEGITYDARLGVQDVLIASENLDSVFVFRNDYSYMSTGRGEYIVDFDLMEDIFWQEKILIERGGAVLFINANKAVYRKNGEPLITIGRAIYDIDSQKKVGLLLVNVSVGMLESELFQQENSDICVLTDEGEYLAGSEELASLFTKEFAKNSKEYKYLNYKKSKRIVAGQKLKDCPIVVMCAAEKKTATVSFEVMAGLLIILIAFIASMSISAVFITRDITGPVMQLTEAMENTRKTGYLEKLDVNMPNNELATLEESYNNMIEHLNDSVDKLILQEKSVQKAEMRVLHEQIKPHFLYNSLETISFMAFDAGADKVHSALETLGSFYRNFLSKGDREIPLKTEINIVKDYLSLQKLRYGDIINDEYDIPDNTKEMKVPKLILQPLVENSIYHGIRLTGEPGLIKITTRVENGDLYIYVRDTGVGMTEDTIHKILDKNTQDSFESSDNKHSGFGLRGTIERIRYYCGEDDTVSISSELGEYTEIRIRIPNAATGRENLNV